MDRTGGKEAAEIESPPSGPQRGGRRSPWCFVLNGVGRDKLTSDRVGESFPKGLQRTNWNINVDLPVVFFFVDISSFLYGRTNFHFPTWKQMKIKLIHIDQVKATEGRRHEQGEKGSRGNLFKKTT